MEEYMTKAGKKLRQGYTTGSCAAAAAKAAAAMLLSKKPVSHVSLRTPKGRVLLLEVENISFHRKNDAENTPDNASSVLYSVSCAVRKDSGDDPDVTNGTLIYAEVAFSPVPGIRIEGGDGVGRVTKQGLDQPVGEAAINSTPRRMIAEAVQEVWQKAICLGEENSGSNADFIGCRNLCLPDPLGETETAQEKAAGSSSAAKNVLSPGFVVTISVPGGRELAEKTFNPRLGIIGGISILGTTGIVEPMSDEALKDTIRTEIRVRRYEGMKILPAAPGSYGKAFFLKKYGFQLDTAVTTSNYIRDTVEMAVAEDFTRMLFVGHIGKLVKVAGGIPNTHSKYGDRRMEILTEFLKEACSEQPEAEAADSGKTGAILEAALSDCVSTDEAVRLLRLYRMDGPVLSRMTLRIKEVMEDWSGGRMQIEVIVFSNVYGELGKTDGAELFLTEIMGNLPGDQVSFSHRAPTVH